MPACGTVSQHLRPSKAATVAGHRPVAGHPKVVLPCEPPNYKIHFDRRPVSRLMSSYMCGNRDGRGRLNSRHVSDLPSLHSAGRRGRCWRTTSPDRRPRRGDAMWYRAIEPGSRTGPSRRRCRLRRVCRMGAKAEHGRFLDRPAQGSDLIIGALDPYRGPRAHSGQASPDHAR